MQSPSQRAPGTSWYSLPWDIRYDILILVADMTGKESPSRAGYTRVAKEWVPIFESRTFSSLRILRRDISRFEEIFLIKRRRRYLQHLTFVPDLCRMDPFPQIKFCEKGKKHHLTEMFYIHKVGATPKSCPEDSAQFSNDMGCLFHELAKWNPRQSCPSGISLKILIPDKSFWQRRALKLRQQSGPNYVWWGAVHDPEIRQLTDSYFEEVMNAASLNFHHYLTIHPWAIRRKMVDVVSSLFISGENTHRIDARAVACIMNCLPCLRTITWKVMPFTRQRFEDAFYEGLSKTIREWPTSLETIKIYQMDTSSRTGAKQSHPLLSSSLAVRSQQIAILNKLLRPNHAHRDDSLSMEVRPTYAPYSLQT
ncbi:hypothetical protein FSPOR_3011 [Fusarium sporotrichioides]|uniref:Uncharacterized protein n=1 Tax=Fusarium sporotrichioides TaxID=5514 RepID=A0A395SHM1_FUSSP|nr:hypothetical protein FSPOR_3011 [Fusarium sporotrichioides]